MRPKPPSLALGMRLVQMSPPTAKVATRKRGVSACSFSASLIENAVHSRAINTNYRLVLNPQSLK